VRILGQESKQALQPGARDLLAAITSPRQQDQLSGLLRTLVVPFETDA